MSKPLPIGVQTFRDIIQGGFLYVDKTRIIHELIHDTKGVFFFSRPRRFGKSLLVSTLEEIFLGHRQLFQGLWLDDSPYAWPQHPVIHIDFSRHRVHSAAGLEIVIGETLQRIAVDHGIDVHGHTHLSQFENLIRGLAAQNQVVILIDEYDKPILDNIEDRAEAQRIQDVLKGFYTVIKSLDAHIRFVFLTGISKFSRVGVFSGLNNLQDISLHDRYATLLGFTQAEVEQNFGAYLHDFAVRNEQDLVTTLAEIRAWYNGFCFSRRCETVYNPFSMLLLLDSQDFRNYWFESGTPTFLVKLIQQQNYDIQQLDDLNVDELAFSTYEIDRLQVLPLLYQTGYLTIKGYDAQRQLYRLGYPNREVEKAFTQVLLGRFGAVDESLTGGYLWRLIDALGERNLAQFFELLDAFFAGIPYDIQIGQERYYQTIFYLIFRLIGLEIEAEVRTSRGRIDTVVALADTVYLFEFKLDGDPDAALAQIQARGYAEAYAQSGKTLILAGVNFDTTLRGIAGWQTKTL